MGSFDRPGQPDEPERPDDHRKGGSDVPGDAGKLDRSGNMDRPGASQEPESSREERLGLSGLTRADVWKSQRSQADAQEAEARSDFAAPRGWADPDSEAPADSGVPVPREAAEPELGPGRDTPGGGADRWGLHRTEDHPATNVEAPGRYYWTEVPRFLTMWREHEGRWPARPAENRDYDVTPDLRVSARDEIAAAPRAEPPLSDAMKKAEAKNPADGWLAGFEYRLKGSDRLLEKALEGLEAQPESTPKEVVGRIPDAIRYTFCFDQNNYSAGYWNIKERLEASGYDMYYSKNSWTDAEYKGINTRWVTPAGQRFEVQFHTRESFHAKHEVTHHAYERLRDPRTSRSERSELKNFQRDVSSWIPVPKNVTDIPDHKRDISDVAENYLFCNRGRR